MQSSSRSGKDSEPAGPPPPRHRPPSPPPPPTVWSRSTMAHSAAAEQAGRQGSSPGAETGTSLAVGMRASVSSQGGHPEASLGKDLNEALCQSLISTWTAQGGRSVCLRSSFSSILPPPSSACREWTPAGPPRLSLVPTAPHLPGKSEQEPLALASIPSGMLEAC